MIKVITVYSFGARWSVNGSGYYHVEHAYGESQITVWCIIYRIHSSTILYGKVLQHVHVFTSHITDQGHRIRAMCECVSTLTAKRFDP